MLCKHEVVGSIPSASTRSLGEVTSEIVVFTVCSIGDAPVIVRETSFAFSVFTKNTDLRDF